MILGRHGDGTTIVSLPTAQDVDPTAVDGESLSASLGEKGPLVNEQNAKVSNTYATKLRSKTSCDGCGAANNRKDVTQIGFGRSLLHRQSVHKEDS